LKNNDFYVQYERLKKKKLQMKPNLTEEEQKKEIMEELIKEREIKRIIDDKGVTSDFNDIL